MTVVLTKRAQRDLIEIYEFVGGYNPAAAERLLARLFDILRWLADGELSGPEVRLTDGRRVHRWFVPPYRVYYRRTTRRTVIVRVYHQARRPCERQSAP